MGKLQGNTVCICLVGNKFLPSGEYMQLYYTSLQNKLIYSEPPKFAYNCKLVGYSPLPRGNTVGLYLAGNQPLLRGNTVCLYLAGNQPLPRGNTVCLYLAGNQCLPRENTVCYYIWRETSPCLLRTQ